MSNDKTRRTFIGNSLIAVSSFLAGCSGSDEPLLPPVSTPTASPTQTVGPEETPRPFGYSDFDNIHEATDWANEEMLNRGYTPVRGQNKVVRFENQNETVYFDTRASDLLEQAEIDVPAPDMRTLSAAGADAIKSFIDDVSPSVAAQFEIFDEAYDQFNADAENRVYNGAVFDIGSPRSSWILEYEGEEVDNIHSLGDVRDPQGLEEITPMELRIVESLLGEQFTADGFITGNSIPRFYRNRIYVSGGDFGRVSLVNGNNVYLGYLSNDENQVLVEDTVYDVGEVKDMSELGNRHGLSRVGKMSPVAPYDEGIILEGVAGDENYDFA